MKFYVYQLKASDEDQPFYIGKSFEGSKRMIEHSYDSRKTKRMKCSKMKSIQARGADTIQEILHWFVVEEEAHKKEIELIAFYGRRDNRTGILCNHTDGGEGIVGQIISKETREKMSKAKRGNKINVGRKRPDFAVLWKKPITIFDLDGNVLQHCSSGKEATKITGVNNKSVSDCCRGKCKTAKSKKDGRVYRFKLGIITKEIDSIQHRQHQGLGKVHQYTKDGIFVREYRNSKEAEQLTNIAGSSIRKCIHGQAKTAGGFTWSLADNKAE